MENWKAKVVILGAGEHGRLVNACCSRLNYEVMGFLDDSRRVGELINGVPVLGGFEYALSEEFDDDVIFHVAVGNSNQREKVSKRLYTHNRRLANIIHPLAELTPPYEIGEAIYIGAFSFLAVNVRIDDYVVVYSNCTIGSDTHIENSTMIAAGSRIGRAATIGRSTFIGTGATILPEIYVGSRCIIGAGSVVTKSIPDNCIAYGSPCRVIRTNGQALHELENVVAQSPRVSC